MRGPTPSYPFLLDTCCREYYGIVGMVAVSEGNGLSGMERGEMEEGLARI